jgi:ubiquinone/menaquinone biosynthesis C-methylase UbiE
VLQEFHNVPNGNYSNALSRGYARGFDIAMLGTMRDTRRRMAEALASCDAVLDVGCGGGASSEALVAAGVREVWGLDPSLWLNKWTRVCLGGWVVHNKLSQPFKIMSLHI